MTEETKSIAQIGDERIKQLDEQVKELKALCRQLAEALKACQLCDSPLQQSRQRYARITTESALEVAKKAWIET